MPLPTPTVELAVAEGDEFDREPSIRLIEDALGQLRGEFPHNTETSHVLLKVVAVNRLYATQIFDVETVARHIAALDIDPLLVGGLSQAVDLIAKVSIGGKVRNNFSFATNTAVGTIPLLMRFTTGMWMNVFGPTRSKATSQHSLARTFGFTRPSSKS